MVVMPLLIPMLLGAVYGVANERWACAASDEQQHRSWRAVSVSMVALQISVSVGNVPAHLPPVHPILGAGILDLYMG